MRRRCPDSNPNVELMNHSWLVPNNPITITTHDILPSFRNLLSSSTPAHGRGLGNQRVRFQEPNVTTCLIACCMYLFNILMCIVTEYRICVIHLFYSIHSHSVILGLHVANNATISVQHVSRLKITTPQAKQEEDGNAIVFNGKEDAAPALSMAQTRL